MMSHRATPKFHQITFDNEYQICFVNFILYKNLIKSSRCYKASINFPVLPKAKRIIRENSSFSGLGKKPLSVIKVSVRISTKIHSKMESFIFSSYKRFFPPKPNSSRQKSRKNLLLSTILKRIFLLPKKSLTSIPCHMLLKLTKY